MLNPIEQLKAPTQSANVDILLNRLDGVKKTGPGKWIARCPGHDDRHASLSIKLTHDDVILMRCFAGCETDAVLASIGLNYSELFPAKSWRDYDPSQPRPKTPRFNKSELFDLLLIESIILAMAFSEALETGKLTDIDNQRARQAFASVMRLQSEVAR